MIREFDGTIEHQRASRQSVVVERVEEKMPTPDSLLAAALNEPRRVPSVSAGDYASVVHELRGKGLTWGEVVSWLSERGVVFSQPGIQSAYRKRFGEEYR